jgi:hypothetical protein
MESAFAPQENPLDSLFEELALALECELLRKPVPAFPDGTPILSAAVVHA